LRIQATRLAAIRPARKAWIRTRNGQPSTEVLDDVLMGAARFEARCLIVMRFRRSMREVTEHRSDQPDLARRIDRDRGRDAVAE
jgi:hypothetical protein